MRTENIQCRNSLKKYNYRHSHLTSNNLGQFCAEKNFGDKIIPSHYFSSFNRVTWQQFREHNIAKSVMLNRARRVQSHKEWLVVQMLEVKTFQHKSKNIKITTQIPASHKQ